ncbi:MAG: hypothetical protein QM533_07300 [Cytophagales bacterium]|nr:hypothetical protein [Cytophagales bacterium]
MCLIVDANLAQVVLNKPSAANSAYLTLSKAVCLNRYTIFHGGKLSTEYAKCGILRSPLFIELSRSGRAIKIATGLINTHLPAANNLCRSNDQHIIALAKAAPRARVLVSDDKALQADFKNKSLVNNPRGKVYSPTRHNQSLTNC